MESEYSAEIINLLDKHKECERRLHDTKTHDYLTFLQDFATWSPWVDKEGLPLPVKDWLALLHRSQKGNPFNDRAILCQSSELQLLLLRLRDDYIAKVGFALNTRESTIALAKEIFSHGCSAVDIGCGSGALVKALNTFRGEVDEPKFCKVDGVNLPISDERSMHSNRYTEFFIEPIFGYGPELVGEYDNVILSWPDYDTPFALETARAIKQGARLFYCGEHEGGCTGDADFHTYLEENFVEDQAASTRLNADFLQFFGVHDYWWVLTKRGKR